MDLEQESSRFVSQPQVVSIRNLSSSSSAFYSAYQSPLFSPSSPASQLSESKRSEIHLDSAGLNGEHASTHGDSREIFNSYAPVGVSNSLSSLHGSEHASLFGHKERPNRSGCDIAAPCTPSSASISHSRMRSYDVFMGLHSRKRSLLRFAHWLRADLEVQGVSCFVCDRVQSRSSRKHCVIDKAMDASAFGVVILTSKSFRNPYAIEDMRYFSGKKNLVPIYFDLGPGDCLVRDIVERRGEMWEKHGGELWHTYGGMENEWKEAVSALTRDDDWRLEGQDGNWRDCIFRTVTLIALRLGRRSVVDRLTKWREMVDREEFPFPRNDNFVGRLKELSELEFILFGDVSGEREKDYFDLHAKPRRKNIKLGCTRKSSAGERTASFRIHGSSRKGKEPAEWKESENEIELQTCNYPQVQKKLTKTKNNKRCSRRNRYPIIQYGKGIACVSGEPGIGKSELLLEYAYRYHQRYKMVLWIGGESKYLRQNYLNLWPFLEVDVGIENCIDSNRNKSFEEQEEAAIFRVRKELMRNIPFLVIIDNLESEKDWWDSRLVMDLLPRFGGETHIIISTRLPRVLNLEPMKLSYLSGVEAMSLMQRDHKDYSSPDIGALRVLEEKLERSTLSLAIVGAILTELPISPCRLLDTINRMPVADFSTKSKRSDLVKRKAALLQLLEFCFSIFDHNDGPKSLPTLMVFAGAWCAPAPVPFSLLTIAAQKILEKNKDSWFCKRIMGCVTCGFSTSYSKKSETEAVSLLVRFNIARMSNKPGHIHFNELIKLYARERTFGGEPEAIVQTLISRGSIHLHSEHFWASCFLIFGFGNPTPVKLKVSDLLAFIKEIALPLAIRTFVTFSRSTPALELLRLSINALEAVDQEFVTPVKRWLDKSLCWRPAQTNAQLNPSLWQELALLRATVLETRAKLMLRGGEYGIADDLIRKSIFIRTFISGENHSETRAARETLSKITRLIANVQIHTS
ncbi:unnamed protein product [Rhodiola kirilowii]